MKRIKINIFLQNWRLNFFLAFIYMYIYKRKMLINLKQFNFYNLFKLNALLGVHNAGVPEEEVRGQQDPCVPLSTGSTALRLHQDFSKSYTQREREIK